jgi:hypothetical protein
MDQVNPNSANELSSTEEVDETQALIDAQNAVEAFHVQVALDPNAHPQFAQLIAEHPMLNSHRAENEELQRYSMYFNSIFMAADLYGVGGDTIAGCYAKITPPTADEISSIETFLTRVPMVNLYLSSYTTPNGSVLPDFFAALSKDDEVGHYAMLMIPNLTETPSVSFRLTFSASALKGVKMEIVNGAVESVELQQVPPGIMALTRAAMVALSFVEAETNTNT